MVAKRDFIEGQIADCEKRLQEANSKILAAQREKDIAQAQLEAFYMVLGQPAPKTGQDEVRPNAVNGKATRKRKPTGTWTSVLQQVAVLRVATLDQIEQFLSESGTPTDRKNIRSQMSNYRKRGIIADGTNNGEYSLTDDGYKQFAPPDAGSEERDDGWGAGKKESMPWESENVTH